ncbi:DUF1836 domain-containing protein [Marinicrinis lubricantis]|uniref:DUF1836 domain-containing protein n=1 Tax=Marinicrinis lubricantis TaxID=2086470 RepID=A0ABW1ITA8_9BACL
MRPFYLTRTEMALLLQSLKEQHSSPITIFQQAWAKHHRHTEEIDTEDFMLRTVFPPIFDKLMKEGSVSKGLSLNDIVQLGSQIEYTDMPLSTVQNWVKRDVKEIIGAPRMGKKYGVNQAALLFIVDDLKHTLDFVSIRTMLGFLFNHPDTDDDDILHPLDFYALYAGIFEELDQNNDQLLDIGPNHAKALHKQDHLTEELILRRVKKSVEQLSHMDSQQQRKLQYALSIAIISVQTAYFRHMANSFYHATIFI